MVELADKSGDTPLDDCGRCKGSNNGWDPLLGIIGCGSHDFEGASHDLREDFLLGECWIVLPRGLDFTAIDALASSKRERS